MRAVRKALKNDRHHTVRPRLFAGMMLTLALLATAQAQAQSAGSTTAMVQPLQQQTTLVIVPSSGNEQKPQAVAPQPILAEVAAAMPGWLVKAPPSQVRMLGGRPPVAVVPMPDWLVKAPPQQQFVPRPPQQPELPDWLVKAPPQQQLPRPVPTTPAIPDFLVKRPPARAIDTLPTTSAPEIPEMLVKAPPVQQMRPPREPAGPAIPDFLVKAPPGQHGQSVPRGNASIIPDFLVKAPPSQLPVNSPSGSGAVAGAPVVGTRNNADAPLTTVLNDGAETTAPNPRYAFEESAADRRAIAAVLSGAGSWPVADEITVSDNAAEADDDANFHLASFAKQMRENDGKADNDQPQTYGQKPPPSNNTLQFLRRQAVLLKPGDMQVDTGVIYTLFNQNIPVPVTTNGVITNVLPGRVDRRLLYSPFAARLGLTERVQLFGFLPIGWANSEVQSVGIAQFSDHGPVGDLTAGTNMLCREGCGGYSPTVITTFAFTAPTGNFTSPVVGLVPGSALSQGFWALQGQMLFINQYDPIVAFYGFGYRHLFQRSFSGQEFQPGEQINYQFGVGFAVNDRITLSTNFYGYYITNTYLNGKHVPGSNQEPLSLRFAATIARETKIWEPFALIGMTDQAPAAQVGFILTFR